MGLSHHRQASPCAEPRARFEVEDDGIEGQDVVIIKKMTSYTAAHREASCLYGH